MGMEMGSPVARVPKNQLWLTLNPVQLPKFCFPRHIIMVIAVLYDCCPFTGWDFHLLCLLSKLFTFRVFVSLFFFFFIIFSFIYTMLMLQAELSFTSNAGCILLACFPSFWKQCLSHSFFYSSDKRTPAWTSLLSSAVWQFYWTDFDYTLLFNKDYFL